jgi:hypothetical protein
VSNKNKHRLSLKGTLNVPTTEPIALPVAEPNAHSQEKTMEAVQDKSPEASAELIGPTAKQLAAAEEENAVRARKLIELQNEQGASQEPVSVIGLAAQGREALLEGLRQHAARSKPKEYVPPPRTERQMSALEEELEAGRRAQQKAEAQQASRPVPPADPKEGFTTPAYRPGDRVPDPVTGKLGAFGKDA